MNNTNKNNNILSLNLSNIKFTLYKNNKNNKNINIIEIELI